MKNGDNVPEGQDLTIRKRILDWAAPCFPLEIRDQAAQVYMDYIRSKHNEDIDYFAPKLNSERGGCAGIIGNGAGA